MIVPREPNSLYVEETAQDMRDLILKIGIPL